ncbi:MAG: high-potential iron-sulfur protein [Pseudomonadota bacterium]|nr:high-potential iron-sulfur protein [Pseudomonadota bacterium]
MNLTRRSILKNLGIATAAGLTAAVPARRARAEVATPHLDLKDPAAVALGYVEHVSQVDLKKYPDYVKDSRCENCLQLQGNAGDNYRPCKLFPGKLVAVSGWCTGWTPEM